MLIVTATALAACSTDGRPVAALDDLGSTPTITSSAAPGDGHVPLDRPTRTYSLPSRTTTPTVEVPPPPDSATITCREYAARDKPTQTAIVKANGVTKNPILVATLVLVLCGAEPQSTVNSVLGRMKDEIIHN
ncbi:hypothetical protein [Gordonia sp. 'Campus']|uniref:hypothetical protein n=1 Tax=Gordonia sp. 'Campus' TaxID=2915824 RepID=UPI001EE48D3A|nr:hypothetical protein [Gordonia sp. 'Campus']